MADLEAIYNSYAGDAEGITAEQAETALQEAGHNPTDEVTKYYEEHEMSSENGDLLSLEQFLEIANSMEDPNESLLAAFKVIAGDDDFIDKDELMTIIRTQKELSGEDYTDDGLVEAAEELIAQFDTNNDNKLDINELTAAINAGHIDL